MKRLIIDFPGHGGGKLFDPEARDACTGPFIHLRNVLRDRGYQLETAETADVSNCEWVLFWGTRGFRALDIEMGLVPTVLRALPWRARKHFQTSRLYRACLTAKMEQRIAMFMAEPPVISQTEYSPIIQELFPVVFTWHDDYVDGKRFRKFLYPQPGRFPTIRSVPFANRKLLTNISGNNHSSHLLELYSARRATIRHFEQYHPNDFDLYGVGWQVGSQDGRPYPSYRGAVKHKWDVYPHYRFGLCYENMREAPGFVTEKIFDCMRAGCVPVYWGAPNIAKYVSRDAFIDRREFASEKHLADFLLSVDERKHQEYLGAIDDYLRSPRFQQFLPPAFAEGIIKALSL